MPSVMICIRLAARLLKKGVMAAVIVAIAALQSEDIRLVGCCGDRQFAIRTARARAVDSAVYVEEPVREVEHAERQRAKIG